MFLPSVSGQGHRAACTKLVEVRFIQSLTPPEVLEECIHASSGLYNKRTVSLLYAFLIEACNEFRQIAKHGKLARSGSFLRQPLSLRIQSKLPRFLPPFSLFPSVKNPVPLPHASKYSPPTSNFDTPPPPFAAALVPATIKFAPRPPKNYLTFSEIHKQLASCFTRQPKWA